MTGKVFRISSLGIFTGIVGIATALSATPAFAQQVGDKVPNTWSCDLAPGTTSLNYHAGRAAGQARGRVLSIYKHIGPGFSLYASPQAVAAMVKNNPQVIGCVQAQYVGLPEEAAALSYTTKGGPGGGGKPGGSDPGGTTDPEIPWGVARVSTGTANGHKAWVVDTGVSKKTGDLTVVADDPNGGSRSFYGPSTEDDNGHGTHVAGTIAALKNNKGVAGVAPGAPIVSVRVLDANGVAPDTIVKDGLDYVLDHAAFFDVVNLSVNADPGSSILDASVRAFDGLGIYLVIAAGNSNTNVNSASRPSPPADIDGDGIFSVAAIDNRDKLAIFSNYGSSVDYAEPGTNIVSLGVNGALVTKSGTSMAAPHLSGILLSGNGTIKSGGTVKDRLRNTIVIGVNP